MAPCPHCRVENPPGARFCNGCGARLGEGPRETRKTVTVLFCDVAGYTGRGERLDPEALRALQSRYFEVARTTLERHGATVEKFIGDAVMAVFGIPVLHEDDALRAVRAALELQRAVSTLGLQVRIGINTGEVFAGDPGAGHGFVTGDPVNTAKRLEEKAGASEIVAGERTWRLIRDAVSAEPLEPLSLRGKGGTTAAYRLLGLQPSVQAGRHRSPLVGREDERRLLEDALAWVVDHRACRLFTLQGAAGVGKSRLVEEFVGGLAGRANVIRGRCLPYGEGITFWPLAEVVRDATGLSVDEPADAARAKLEALLAHEEQAGLIAERIGQLIGLSNSLAGGEESFWAVRRFLETLARSQPLVVLLDDIHWAEPTFLDLVEHVAEWSRDAPVLLLCLARLELSELRPSWGTGKLSATVLLEPLGEAESLSLVDSAVGAVDEETRRKIVAAAEGNPLFLEEMSAMLVEEGTLRETPPTIQAVISARIERLDTKERAVLEAASVEGRVFHRGAVVELVGETLRGEVGAQLAKLVRKELVWPTRSGFAREDAFRFRHLLIRDAAYESLPKEARSDLHERFAEWLQERAGARAGEQDELLGYHLQLAYRYRVELGPRDERAAVLAARAGELLGRAGRRAFGRDDMHAARVLLERAVGLLPEDDPGWLELARELSAALWAVGDADRAMSLLDRVVEGATGAGERRIEWYARLDRASHERDLDAREAADQLLRVSNEAIPVFQELGDDLGLARAWRRLAHVEHHRCHFAQSQAAAERALDHARQAGHRQEEARCADALCTSLLYGPAAAGTAIERCRSMLAVAGDNRLFEANVLCALAGLEGMQARFGEALELCSQARRSFEDLGLRLPMVGVDQIAGEIELLAGRADAAVTHFRPGYDFLAQAGAWGYISTFAALLARALLLQGEQREAAELAALARENAADSDIGSRVLACAITALVDESVDAADEAVSLAATTDALNLHGDALMTRAQVLRSAGRFEDASRSLEHAHRLYEQKGNLVSSGVAALLLAEAV